MTFQVESAVVREIWAVIHLALGFITFLSLSNNFGIVGEFWVGILSPVLGWGVNILPYMFFLTSLLLFLSKRITFPLSRITGIFLMIFSILSILHLYVPMEELYSAAQAGEYGGYVGFVSNFMFRQILNVGQLGAAVIFLTVLVIGILLTFEIPISALMAVLKPELKIVRKKSGKVSKKEEDDVEIEDLDEIDEEESEAELLREKFKLENEQGGVEMVTIKRVNDPIEQKVQEKEKVIEIKEQKEDQVLSVDKETEEFEWKIPSLDLLSPSEPDVTLDDKFLQKNAKIIHDKLKQFGIDVEMHEVHVGPTVIQYTLKPAENIKLSKITALKSDLALALAAKAIRIEAPIPGKSLVGIEVPNDKRSLVRLREMLEHSEMGTMSDSKLILPLGRDVSGKPLYDDLDSMPHLLVAGATGSGKSVGMNSFLISLIYQNSPADLRLILMDPKRVELTNYNGIPHLLTPVITDPEKAAIALRWAVAEMNRRYHLCSETKHRNISEYNACKEKHEEDSEEVGHKKIPNIVIVVDELADLMMAAGKEVEASICRVAQMARAVGIHLIIATQRPSVDVITGLIKANIPSRIAYAVSSSIDSRTILDGIGAEDLLGKGDMLYLASGQSKPVRIQGIFISSKEIERVTNNIKITMPPNYLDDIISPRVAQSRVPGVPDSNLADMDDEDLYNAAFTVVTETRKASASLLQRRLKIGYARAARLLDQMEEEGVIGPVNGAKPREIYMD
jgi:S-DNA-T family DNA segregation ATPase FtsK/SpoIIIE